MNYSETIDRTVYGDCDWIDYGMMECCKLKNDAYFDSIDLDEEYYLAVDSVDDRDRLPSNFLWKRQYKCICNAADVGTPEKHERRKLSNCAVNRVQQINPNEKGEYMGHKKN